MFKFCFYLWKSMLTAKVKIFLNRKFETNQCYRYSIIYIYIWCNCLAACASLLHNDSTLCCSSTGWIKVIQAVKQYHKKKNKDKLWISQPTKEHGIYVVPVTVFPGLATQKAENKNITRMYITLRSMIIKFELFQLWLEMSKRALWLIFGLYSVLLELTIST